MDYNACSMTARYGTLDWAPVIEVANRPIFEKFYQSVRDGAETRKSLEFNGHNTYREVLAREFKRSTKTTRRSGTRGRLSIPCHLTTSYDINWCDSDAPVGGGQTRACLPVPAPHPELLFARATPLAVSTDVGRHPHYEGDAPTSHRIRRYREAQVTSTSPHCRRSHHPPPLKMQTISLPGTSTGTPFSPPTKQKSSNNLFSWPSVQSNSVLEILSPLVISSSKTSFVSLPSPPISARSSLPKFPSVVESSTATEEPGPFQPQPTAVDRYPYFRNRCLLLASQQCEKYCLRLLSAFNSHYHLDHSVPRYEYDLLCDRV